MPVYQENGSGRFYVKFRKTDPVTRKQKQITKRGFESRKEASRWEAQNRFEISTTTSVTFWDMFQLYLDNNDTSEGTRKKKEAFIEMYFQDFRDTPINRIMKSDLVEWRTRLKMSGLAVRTMNTGMQYVRSVFTFYSAVYGGQNVSVVLKAFKQSKKEKKEMDIWTPEEFDTFIEAVEDPVYKAFYTFLFWTGCRRGEAMALCREDFFGNHVHFHRSIKHYANGFQPLKTDSSDRIIALDSELMEVLRPLIRCADPFVFGGTKSLSITSIQGNFKSAIENSGVKQIRIHDLRHSHASILLNNGVNVLAVSKRLGHANVTQTLDTYAHLMQETDEAMLKTIETIKSRSQYALSISPKTAEPHNGGDIEDFRADEGNRTPVCSLEGCRSTIELHLHKRHG